MIDDEDRALARMAHLLGPEFVRDAEAGFIKEKDMNAEIISVALAKLQEAQEILVEECHRSNPDMLVTEWNATPPGRAVRRISDAIEQIEKIEVES